MLFIEDGHVDEFEVYTSFVRNRQESVQLLLKVYSIKILLQT